jgi:hypothetical protein
MLTVLGLAKVGFRKHQSSNLEQKLIESTNVQPSTEAPLLPNPCCAFVPFQVVKPVFFYLKTPIRFLNVLITRQTN